MATVINYTCKGFIKLIPGYSLYRLIAVCVKISGGRGGGYSLLWPIRVGSTRRKGVKNSFKFQIPFCEIIRFEQYCSKVLPKRFYLNGNTTAFHPKVKTIIAIEWFVALVFQGIQPPYRWGTRVTKRASDRE